MLSPMSRREELRLIRCQVGAESFCFPMAWVRSIQRSDLMEPAGDAPEDAATVGRLAAFGARVPVTGLARRLRSGAGASPAGPAPDRGGGAVVVIDDADGPWGLLVDRVSRLPALDADAVLPLPAIADDPERGCFRGVVRLGEEDLALYLALERLRPGAAPVGAAAGADAASGRSAGRSSAEEPEGRRPGRPAAAGAGPRAVPATPAAEPGRLVLFSCGVDGRRSAFTPGLSFALSLSQVQEVSRPRPLTPVPGAPPYLLGIVPWRRRAVPVIDLPRRLGLAASPGADARLLVARGAAVSELIAFPVRSEVRMLALPLPCRPRQPELTLDTTLVRGLFEVEGEGGLLLPDLDRLLISR